MSSSYNDYDGGRAEADDRDPEAEATARYTWEVLSWILVVLTLVLNLVVIIVLFVRRNAYTVTNKGILTLAVVDLIYGIFVSPFFVQNYVRLDWGQSLGYCQFYVYIFTFHDLFVPLVLILLSAYISLKYSGATAAFGKKKMLYLALFFICMIFALLLAIPATVNTYLFKDPAKDYVECKSLETYTMILAYFLLSSLLFCFTMSFLFSLCIVGSPFLRDVFDEEEYSQRWRFLLSLSLVNVFYIITGFLLNFKEISRLMKSCCEVHEPFDSMDSITYEVWSFVLLISEPFWRPLTFLVFYFKYLMSDPSEY